RDRTVTGVQTCALPIYLAGIASLQRGGEPLPPALFDSIHSTGLALKTSLLSPSGPTRGNWNVQFRRELGLFAAVRPLKNLRGLQIGRASCRARAWVSVG